MIKGRREKGGDSSFSLRDPIRKPPPAIWFTGYPPLLIAAVPSRFATTHSTAPSGLLAGVVPAHGGCDRALFFLGFAVDVRGLGWLTPPLRSVFLGSH